MFTNLLQRASRWFSLSQTRRSSRRGKASFRPGLERLEERAVPATITFDGGPTGTGTAWTLAENWSEDPVTHKERIPGYGDDVVIPSRTGGGFNVELSSHWVWKTHDLRIERDSSLTVVTSGDDIGQLGVLGRLEVAQGARLINQGWLTLAGETSNVLGSLTVNSPGHGLIVVGGKLEITGSAVLKAGVINAAAAGTISLKGSFTMEGGALSLGGYGTTRGVIINEGIFTAASSGLMNAPLINKGTILHTGSGNFSGLLSNHDVYEFHTNAGLEGYRGGSVFNNGTIVKAEGTGVSGIRGLRNERGTLEVRSGTLSLRSGYTTQLSGWTGIDVADGAALDLTEAGVSTAQTYIGGVISIRGPGKVRIPGGTVVVLSGGASLENGQVIWLKGKIVATQGTLTNKWRLKLEGADSKQLTGQLLNLGYINHLGSGALQLAGSLVNRKDYLKLSQSPIVNLGGRGRFSNETGAEFDALEAGVHPILVPFDNIGGRIHVGDKAHLELGSGRHQNGLFNIAKTGDVTFKPGSGSLLFDGTITAGASSNVGGPVYCQRDVGVLNNGATLNFKGGLFWDSGTIGGNALTNTGLLVVRGAEHDLDVSVFTNHGTIQHNSGHLDAGSSPVVNNGTYTLRGAGTNFSSAVSFGNRAVVDVGAGTRLGCHQYNQFLGGTMLRGGTLGVDDWRGTATIFDGTLSGFGTVAGNLHSDGSVFVGLPGRAGTLQVQGSYTQNPGGKLFVQLFGRAAYDRLKVNGQARLGGTMSISLVGGYRPARGTLFYPLYAFGGRVRSFSQFIVPLVLDRANFNNYYFSKGVELRAR